MSSTLLHDIEDNDYTSWRYAVIDGWGLNHSAVEPGTSPAFKAEGCIAHLGSTSCIGAQWVTVGMNQPFRIYTHDLYPVHLPLGWAGLQQHRLALRKHGLIRASGVRWPRVGGRGTARRIATAARRPR
jgi:hypothetical protein